MRIGLQTWGSEGDIRPFFALAEGLQKARHKVTLVVTSAENKDYTSLARSLKINMWQVQLPYFDPERCGRAEAKAVRSVNPFKQVSLVFQELFDPVAPDMYAAAEHLCRDNEVVIGHSLLYPLALSAKKIQRPHVSVFISPNFLRTRSFPPEGLPNLGGSFNTILWSMAEMLMGRVLKTGGRPVMPASRAGAGNTCGARTH